MANSYSPIDESSYRESGSFDPAALYNNIPVSEPSRPAVSETVAEPVPAPAQRPAQPEPQRPAETAYAAPAPVRAHARRKRKIWQMIADSRTAYAFGIVLFFVAAYTFLVCISYYLNIPSDQSAMLNEDFDPTLIRNAGGIAGAWLAHLLVYKWLGLGAFVLIYFVVACALGLVRVYRPHFWNLMLRTFLGAITISVVAGLLTYGMASPVYWGGYHGYLLNTNLITYTGIWGAIAVSLMLVGFMVVLYLTEINRLWRKGCAAYAAYSERQAVRRAERETREAVRRAEREAAVAAAMAERAEREAAEAAEKARREEEARKAAAASVAAAPVAIVTDRPEEEAPAEPQAPVLDPLFATPADTEPVREREETAEEPADTDELEPLFGEASFKSAAEAVKDDYDDVPLVVVNPADEAGETEADGEEEKEAPILRDIHVEHADPQAQGLYDPRADLSHYKFPPLDLLKEPSANRVSVDAEEMEENKQRITKTLRDYGIAIAQIKATVGPTVTLYEIVPAEGVRIAKIKRLEDDIALSLAAVGIRIIAPIPGKGTIGIEVPNKEPQTVSMRWIIESPKYANCNMELPMAMGATISNEVFVADLCKMPHLLVAGATGMGKSVGLNAIIASLLYKKHPSELKFVLVDPKMVEFSLYAKLERHYLAKLPDEEDAIITDPSKVVATLNSLCVEMDNRYALLKDAGMRGIKEYNELFCRHSLNPSKGHRYLPYIVVIVDEFADLIMTAGKEVETPIARIAQKARAVGIHMILATQRPSTNVITGIIKANFPGRVAFRVFQMVDSRTILDRPGANQLIGRGDMLFSNNGKIDRVQCAFIDTPEVKAICDFIDGQVGFDHAYELPDYVPETDGGGSVAALGDRDPLFDECARVVVQSDTASTSMLQRRYSIGYNRAGKIMDQMEAAGIVGPTMGGKPRQVLVDPMALERILENN